MPRRRTRAAYSPGVSSARRDRPRRRSATSARSQARTTRCRVASAVPGGPAAAPGPEGQRGEEQRRRAGRDPTRAKPWAGRRRVRRDRPIARWRACVCGCRRDRDVGRGCPARPRRGRRRARGPGGVTEGPTHTSAARRPVAAEGWARPRPSRRRVRDRPGARRGRPPRSRCSRRRARAGPAVKPTARRVGIPRERASTP